MYYAAFVLQINEKMLQCEAETESMSRATIEAKVNK